MMIPVTAAGPAGWPGTRVRASSARMTAAKTRRASRSRRPRRMRAQSQTPPRSLVGGVVGGVVGGQIGGQIPIGPVEFNDTMTPPQVLSGPNPEYTAQALEHEVEGLMIVKCVVTTQGAVHDCRVLKSLPFMDKSVIEALTHRRYSPALLHGQPIEVDYTFKIKLSLPQ